jgi:hypothetical protein
MFGIQSAQRKYGVVMAVCSGMECSLLYTALYFVIFILAKKSKILHNSVFDLWESDVATEIRTLKWYRSEQKRLS